MSEAEPSVGGVNPSVASTQAAPAQSIDEEAGTHVVYESPLRQLQLASDGNMNMSLRGESISRSPHPDASMSKDNSVS